jgi:hypothetical protein
MISKYQHPQFITNLLETIDLIFFTRLTIECKRSVQHIYHRIDQSSFTSKDYRQY